MHFFEIQFIKLVTLAIIVCTSMEKKLKFLHILKIEDSLKLQPKALKITLKSTPFSKDVISATRPKSDPDEHAHQGICRVIPWVHNAGMLPTSSR